MVGHPSSPSSKPAQIEPFGRPVTVRFHDAIVAASEKAWLVRYEGRVTRIFVPFEDCYQAFLERTGEESHVPGVGICVAWRVQAQNRAEDRAVWVLEQPEPVATELANYATFDPEKLTVDTE